MALTAGQLRLLETALAGHSSTAVINARATPRPRSSGRGAPISIMNSVY